MWIEGEGTSLGYENNPKPCCVQVGYANLNLLSPYENRWSCGLMLHLHIKRRFQ